MNDVPVDWTCPHCGQVNVNHRNIDNLCLCMGLDCFDNRGKRYLATWDEIDNGFLETGPRIEDDQEAGYPDRVGLE